MGISWSIKTNLSCGSQLLRPSLVTKRISNISLNNNFEILMHICENCNSTQCVCQINCASESSEIYFNNTVESENLPNICTCTSTITTFKVVISGKYKNLNKITKI